METIEKAASLGRAAGHDGGARPAPARPLSDSLLANVDVLTPNESEAMILLDRREGTVSLENAPRWPARSGSGGRGRSS